MKRSIMCLGGTLASAALIALGAGCSRGSRPAQTAPTGTSAPPFESNVPSAPPGGEQGPLPPAPGAEMAPPAPPAAGQPTPPAPGEAPPPQPPAEARGMEAPAGAPGENERQLCDTLASSALLHVEDVQHGVAIIAVPRPGHDLASVRDDARHIEAGLEQRTTAQSPSGPDACGLFSIARLPSVSVKLDEGAKSVRILMTTANPAEVKDLRRVTREQVSTLAKSSGHGR